MLPKQNRLTERSDFERLKKEGRLVRGKLLFLSFLKNNLSFCRIGIIVSKKISNKAVERNRIKRVIRRAVRNNILPFFKGYDMVLVARRSILGKEERIESEIKELLGLIK